MVGIVVVSHSAALAEGVVRLAREMAGDELELEAAGGIADDDPATPVLGTDAERVRGADRPGDVRATACSCSWTWAAR